MKIPDGAELVLPIRQAGVGLRFVQGGLMAWATETLNGLAGPDSPIWSDIPVGNDGTREMRLCIELSHACPRPFRLPEEIYGGELRVPE